MRDVVRLGILGQEEKEERGEKKELREGSFFWVSAIYAIRRENYSSVN